MDIGIIGSGVSGLSAGWLLAHNGHQVTVFESANRLGMESHNVDLNQHGIPYQLDVPFRVFNADYWYNLQQMYQHIGIFGDIVGIDGVFEDAEMNQVFTYRHFKFNNRFYPYTSHFSQQGLSMMYQLIKFKYTPRNHLADVTLGRFLEERRYSEAFIYQFFYPLLATVCTVSNRALAQYPVLSIMRLTDSILMKPNIPFRRVQKGMHYVSDKIAASIGEVQLNAVVEQIDVRADGVYLDFADHQRRFDKLVISTQADHAAKLLPDDCRQEKELLARIPYESAKMAIHMDQRFMPRDEKNWSHLNFVVPHIGVGGLAQTAMSTIWVNPYLPELAHQPPIFQTWNPHFEPQADKLIAQRSLSRATVTFDSLQAIRQLQALQKNKVRRIYFTGSYLTEGIPLLESGVVSSMQMIANMGGEIPWQQQNDPA